jgi:hypothetical protein
MRILMDPHVILDVLFNREAFLLAAADGWLGNEQGLLEGFVSAITPVNVSCMAQNQRE